MRAGILSMTSRRTHSLGPCRIKPICKEEARLVRIVNERGIVKQSQHIATKSQSVFDMSGLQYLIMPDGLILEALSGTDDISDSHLRW
jgi:hypothetical protein